MLRLRLILLAGAVMFGLSARADDKPPAPPATPKAEPKADPTPPAPTTADPAKKTDAAANPAAPAKPTPSVIPVRDSSLDGVGASAGPTATVFTKNADEAFDRYVDLAVLGRAWDEMNPALLTDVGLQLAEGERVLLRPHKAVTAAKVLDEALKAAVEKKDTATLDRLAKAADRTGNKEFAGRIAAAKLLGTASRASHPALTIAIDEISLEGLAKFQAVREAIQVAKLKSDRTALSDLEKSLATEKAIPAKQREYLLKQIEDSKKAMPAATDAQSELLNKLGAGSRGGYNPFGKDKPAWVQSAQNTGAKVGGKVSDAYKGTDVGKAGIEAQKQAQAARDRAKAAAEAEAKRLSDKAKAAEAAARKKAGELAEQAKKERDKRLAQVDQAAKDLDKTRLEAHNIGRQIPGQIVKNTIGNGPKPQVSTFTDRDFPSGQTPKPSTQQTQKPTTQKPTTQKPTNPGVIVDDPVKTKPIYRPPTPTWPTNPKPQPSTPSTPSTPSRPEPTPSEEPTEPEPEEEMDTWYTRELVIHNDTEETLQVYVRYYAPDEDDDYSWFPEDKDDKEQWAGPFIVKPGTKTLLKDGDDVIFGNKCQIKATSKNSDSEWGVFDVDLVGEDGYRAKEMTKYTFRLFP